jgi:hypothetical protein
VREILYSAHFTPYKKGEISRYRVTSNGRHEKTLNEFTEDLQALARYGQGLYLHLFRDEDLPAMLRSEAEARSRPPVLQVVTLESPAIPWSAIYDLPLSDHAEEYELCPSIEEFGPGGNGDEPPARCPYEESHRNGHRWKRNQLCPWGFWGLSTIIEQPPTVRRDLEQQLTCAANRPVILMAYDSELDARLRDQHLAALRAEHGTALLDPQVATRKSLESSLSRDMDIIYFYCHVAEGRRFVATRPVPAIELGGELWSAADIASWGRTHEHNRHPLVIINGCHSVEIPAGELFNLVNPFIDWLQASGVIGTETAVEQGLAGWAMELFLAELQNHSVGEALRIVRWRMLKSGNVMGFGYTPYCLAGLTLLPRLEDE